jgi:outer membrane protein insertion porin family/translocation and assembly module TamA
VATALALSPHTVRAQAAPTVPPPAKRTAPREPPPEVRRLTFTGVEHVDLADLQLSIATQATSCASVLLAPFCLISHSPTIQNRFYLDETEFQRDVLRIRLYYWLRGYRDAMVDTSVVKIGPRQVHVTFAVHENAPTLIRSLSITADSSIVGGRARRRVFGMLREHDPLDLVELDSLRAALQRMAWNQGHGDAVVDTSVVVDDSARIADVAVTLVPNHVTTIGRISVTGTHLVRETVVLNALAFRPGDLYRQTTLLESQRNLYESGLFKLAQIQVPPQLDSAKSVNVDVSEAPLHEVRAGPGIDNVDFAQFTAQYTSYNLFGGARRLDISGTAGNLLAPSLSGHGIFRDVAAYVPDSQSISPFLQPTFNASIDLKQPSFLRRASNTASIGVFTHRTINPGVFIDKGYGGQVTFTNEVAIRAPVSLNYRYEINRVEASDVYFCVNFGVCDPNTINTLRTHQSLSPLVLTGYVDRSNVPLAPTRGYTARVDFESASQFTGSDYRYNRAYLDIAAYSGRRRTRHVLSAHLRAGWVQPIQGGDVTGVIHPRKRMYAGGANSVRGYGENELGPRILTIDASTLVDHAKSIAGGTCGRTLETILFCDPNSAGLSRADFIPQPLGGTTLFEGSVEYRFPFPGGNWAQQFIGAVFLDGAVVGHADLGPNPPPLGDRVNGTGAVTPGFGIRYISPIGPVRVDLGLNPNRAEDLVVMTAVPDGAGQQRIVPLPRTRNFSQASNFWGRWVFHLSIGEAY